MQGGSEGQEGQVDRETKIRQHLRRKGAQRSSQHRHQSIAQRAPEFERPPGDYARGMGLSGLLLNARIQVLGLSFSAGATPSGPPLTPPQPRQAAQGGTDAAVA